MSDKGFAREVVEAAAKEMINWKIKMTAQNCLLIINLMSEYNDIYKWHLAENAKWVKHFLDNNIGEIDDKLEMEEAV